MKTLKANDLAWCGARMVTILEINGNWATIKVFGKSEIYDRLVSSLRKIG
jgi:hypothetical protein